MTHQKQPLDYIFWQTPYEIQPNCAQNMHTDVAIIGGGIAGLAAAQQAKKKYKTVILLEKNICGSGASGKSSGFVTPNAELSFTDFSKRFSPHDANIIWNAIISGMHQIQHNIQSLNIACDFVMQDSLIAATSTKKFQTLIKEHKNLAQFNHETIIINAESMQQYLKSDNYYGALLYPGSFSMNPFAYCQGLKQHLIQSNVSVFENTPVLQIDDHTIITPHAKIVAGKIIVCIDKDIPDLQMLNDDVFHVQTFVTVSQSLQSEDIEKIFPKNHYLVWDTDLIYQYFRITPDNRLVLGGGDLLSTYTSEKHHYEYITKKLCCYFKKHFPNIDLQIQYQWPGLIGISKDIAPIAGVDENTPHVFYVAASAGLPIASMLGSYAVDYLLDGRNDLDSYFSPYRSFPIDGFAQKVIGKRLAFMISNVLKQNMP